MVCSVMRSAGLGARVPEASRLSVVPAGRWMASEGRAWPTSTSETPGDFRPLSSTWLWGRLRSQSTRRTRPPSEARMRARLTEVTVLPSPAEVEVTRRMREDDSGQE